LLLKKRYGDIAYNEGNVVFDASIQYVVKRGYRNGHPWSIMSVIDGIIEFSRRIFIVKERYK
jgi:hypothetical protein